MREAWGGAHALPFGNGFWRSALVGDLALEGFGREVAAGAEGVLGMDERVRGDALWGNVRLVHEVAHEGFQLFHLLAGWLGFLEVSDEADADGNLV